MSFHSNGYVGLRIHGSDPKFGRLNPLNLQVLQNPLLTYNSKNKSLKLMFNTNEFDPKLKIIMSIYIIKMLWCE